MYHGFKWKFCKNALVNTGISAISFIKRKSFSRNFFQGIQNLDVAVAQIIQQNWPITQVVQGENGMRTDKSCSTRNENIFVLGHLVNLGVKNKQFPQTQQYLSLRHEVRAEIEFTAIQKLHAELQIPHSYCDVCGYFGDGLAFFEIQIEATKST
jgi:hypothetical protein